MKKNKNTRHIPAKVQKEFIKKLKQAASGGRAVETETIAPAYRDVIESYFGGVWDYDANTDGFFSSTESLFVSLRLLLEAKHDYDLRQVHDRAVIVAQCIYYMKRFEESGHDQPTVIFGCDQDQMFIVYAPPLRKYLEMDYDWNVAPSLVSRHHPDLVEKLEQDMTLATFVYDINDSGFDLNEVMAAIDKLSENNGEYDRIRVQPATIRIVFETFLTMLSLGGKDKGDYETYISLFINSLVGGPNAPRVDPVHKNKVHLVSGKTVTIDTIAYQAFFSRYESNYSDSEIRDIVGMYDVLLEEVARRYSGDYWTPTIWATKAHDMLTEQLGEGWREKYVVWDASCGTKNLTRDYADFTELYLSTLHDYELETSTIYNPEATAFQYDFLNDDMDLRPGMPFGAGIKINPQLYTALSEDKPLVFLMNPPYATGANHGETGKKDVAKTAINSIMKENEYSRASEQLYTQFLFRIMKIKETFNLSNVVVAVFTNDRFMTGAKPFGKFMDDYQNDFVYADGIYFNAGEFADVASSWGISYTIWKTRTGSAEETRDVFPLEVMEATDHGLKSIGQRTVRNAHQEDLLSSWLKEVKNDPADTKRTDLYLQLSGPLKVYSSKNPPRANSQTVSSIGYLHNNANSVEHSPKYVGLYSSSFGSGNGIPVNPTNFERACVVFAVRKALIPDSNAWITGHDNFTRPAADAMVDSQWESFVANCVIFSLFNSAGSNQSAMRSVAYEGQNLNLFNEFFFLPRQKMRDLAERFGNNAIRIDVNSFGSNERFVYSWLESHDDVFSREAQELLDVATDMVVGTFPHRASSDAAEGLHLEAWDAGFTQIRLLAKETEPQLIERWRVALQSLRVVIADQARDYGFLE